LVFLSLAICQYSPRSVAKLRSSCLRRLRSFSFLLLVGVCEDEGEIEDVSFSLLTEGSFLGDGEESDFLFFLVISSSFSDGEEFFLFEFRIFFCFFLVFRRWVSFFPRFSFFFSLISPFFPILHLQLQILMCRESQLSVG